VSSSSVELEGDETGGIVVVVYDITRLKEFEAKSVRKERLSELGNLAAAVAHEIRNPLNTISIAVQRLASEFTPKENAEEYHSFTGQIRSETKRLNDIITRFLALARDEKQRLTKVNLKELVDETCQLLKPEADKLGIELKGYRDPKAVITADPAGLKQILSNLFNNAKEALAGKPGRVVIDVTREEDIVTLAFFDDGPGIPRNVRDKIFTPYYTTKKSGTGLGLSTVHKIVTDAGGEIRMETSHWGGARFVMEFPREK
jgi:signal transduction histidine kinase